MNGQVLLNRLPSLAVWYMWHTVYLQANEGQPSWIQWNTESSKNGDDNG